MAVVLDPRRYTFEGHTQVGTDFPATCDAGNHLVQFYDSDAVLIAAVVELFAAGLEAGEPVVMIGTPSHRRGVSEGLAARGFDLDVLTAGGQVTMLDARDTLAQFMVGDLPDAERFVASVGQVIERAAATGCHTRVRAYGEMVDLLWRGGNRRAAIALEELWNDLAKIHSFSLMCAYLMGDFYQEPDSGPLHEICRTHTHVVPPESHRSLPNKVAIGDRSLEAEIEHRKAVEYALRESLREHRRTEEALRRSEEELRRLLAAEHEARRAAEAAQKTAREADRRKDEFLAMLGHELRNPLAPILTALQMMQLRGVGGEREQQLIERQVRHMARLVDDLLDVSRITRGKVELNRERVELATVLTKAVELASPLLEQRAHMLTVDVARTGLLIDADPFRMAQVLGNLLTNAAKYTDPNGRIRVRAREVDGDVVVTVSDNGIGISEEMLPRVFELFVQSDQALDRAHGGLGIGLSLARGMVEAHGGTIAAHSAGLGKGCEMTVRLPIAEAAAASGLERLAVAPISVDLGAVAHRVLVVDDNIDAAESMADLLRDFGHEVAVAHDGLAALELAGDFLPDTALLDIGLPGMDGFELAGKLRETLPLRRLQLVAVTGYGQDGDKLKARIAGFDVHLVKPIDIRAVLGLLGHERQVG